MLTNLPQCHYVFFPPIYLSSDLTQYTALYVIPLYICLEGNCNTHDGIAYGYWCVGVVNGTYVTDENNSRKSQGCLLCAFVSPLFITCMRTCGNVGGYARRHAGKIANCAAIVPRKQCHMQHILILLLANMGLYVFIIFVFPVAQQPLVGQGLLIIETSRSHFRHTTLGRTPLDEWSARSRDAYLITHNNHKRQTSILSEGFQPAIQQARGGRPTP
jgi:hypothetical protein